MSIHKFLARLCRFIPDPHWRLMTEQYMKVSGKIPEISGELWNFMNDNRKFMKRHSGEYKIISLGADCMPRTFTTLRMLKPCRAAGEKGMPFDLANTEPHALAHFLENDFADYFSKEWSYDFENKRWRNSLWSNMFYPHDKDCDENSLEKLQNRLRGRIKNFYEVMDFPGLVVFVAHKRKNINGTQNECKAEDLDRVAARLLELRKGKPTKVAVIATDWDDKDEVVMQYAKYIRLRYPNAEFRWDGALQIDGIRHGMNFVREVRKLICEGLNIDYNG
ncbi:MAG: hypothetical protein IKD10_09890 [Lentisphaeria bacterium]|nr:hypothetical protein [Lentisphaeria bacterium]